jgi:putative endonuclease
MARQFYIYIMADGRNGTLYIGMTSDLVKRTYQHKTKPIEGHAEKYGISMLVYYEIHQTALAAISREKQLKRWNRQWKIKLIEKMNPYWNDLYEKISA